MPFEGALVKEVFEELKQAVSPDLIFTHNRKDAHQDHRLLGELTWNTFRDHLILEYEIPKYDGDMGQPSVFVPLEAELCQKKVSHLMDAFSVPTEEALVSGRYIFLPHAASRDGMQCSQRVRRGILLPETSAVSIPMNDLKQRTIRGGFAKICSQAANFTLRIGSLMILGRLLEPRDFGLVGMVMAVHRSPESVQGFRPFHSRRAAGLTSRKSSTRHCFGSTCWWAGSSPVLVLG